MSESSNTRMQAVADVDGDNHEEGIRTAPPLGRSPGDTLIDHVPYDHLYRALVEHACQQLLLVLGPAFGPRILAGILEKLPRNTDAENVDTLPVLTRIRHGDLAVLDDEWDFFLWDELASEFMSIFTFARHGEWPRFAPGDSHAEIEALLDHFHRFTAHRGIQVALATGFEWFADTLAAAEARWAIDHGKSVAADNLAALAGVRSKTVANLIAARQISTEADGCVSAAEALRYLGRRRDFMRSTWQTETGEADSEPPAHSLPLPEQAFVPVDADGNAFLPSLARRGRDGTWRYAIGEKAAPEYVNDYWQALHHLARMPTPRWRRPAASGSGGWGLVSAQEGWRRYARADLERMIDALQDGKGT